MSRSLYIAVFGCPVLAAVFVGLVFVAAPMHAQGPLTTVVIPAGAPGRFRIGEKLTYNISFDKFNNAAYIETSVVSRGKLSGQDAVELRSRVKTLGFVSAAFYQFDEDRTVYASPFSGLPIYVSRLLNNGPIPQETIGNYLTTPTNYYDPLTAIFKAREMGGSGSYNIFDNETVHNAVFTPTIQETVRTEAGEFNTVVSTVTGDYLAANGIKELKINFSTDENHLPVLIRLRNSKGTFRASLLAVQLAQPTVVVPPTVAPTAAQVVTPKPRPTETPYLDNQPLSRELGFDLGESLDYNVIENGRPIAKMSLKVIERKMFQGEDSLLLTAIITGVEPGNQEFAIGDIAQAHVDPETLAPRQLDYAFAGAWRPYNQTIIFDKTFGTITARGKKIDAPIGTHSLVSLLYAMRSFNLKPSKDPNNPVNDTRVAVFIEGEPTIFTLRPSSPADIVVNGQNISAQLVAIKTGNEKFDKQGLKVWLDADTRVPVRFSYGPYEASLIQPVKPLP